jgi:Flp pilus assembly protein TadG
MGSLNISRRRGVSLVYMVVVFTVMFGFASLAVDWGRVQLAKSQLQQAADAAARFGASGLENGSAAALANALAVGSQNSVDGSPLVLDPNNDVAIGTWDATAHTFTPLPTGSQSSANAVQVTAHCIAARNTAIQLYFAQIFGMSSCDINATSVATITYGMDQTFSDPATSNPYLAGEPPGTEASLNNPHNSPDYAGTPSNPLQSPVQVSGIPIVPGSALTFDSVQVGANNFSSSTLYTPDGNTGWIVDDYDGAELGKSDVFAPINAVMGVFLGPNDPATDGIPVPPTLDFSTDDERNFQTLQPQLKQVFFIGDGRRDDGSVQSFVVPPGATRFYLATMDGYQWNNNVGGYNVTVHQVGTVTLVK